MITLPALSRSVSSCMWKFREENVFLFDWGSTMFILQIRWIHFVLSEYLKVRSHDPEEAIRHDVIVSIVTASKKDLALVNDHLLNFVRERTLDKRVRSLRCLCLLLLFLSTSITGGGQKTQHIKLLLSCDISAFSWPELISSAVSLELHSISLPNLICSLFGPPGSGGQMKYRTITHIYNPSPAVSNHIWGQA